MSRITENLPQSVVQKWRLFVGTPEFIHGIDWLRHNHAPKVANSGTSVEKFEAAVGWSAYQQALTDVEDLLTALQKDSSSLDEPPLRNN